MKKIELIEALKEKALKEIGISPFEARELLYLENSDLPYLFAASNEIRRYFRGNKVSLCAITNAKSGECFEDCKFCAQSHYYHTGIATYPLISLEEMLIRAEKAIFAGAHRFCLVTSGGQLSENEIEQICLGVSKIKEKFPGVKLDASLGKINYEHAKKLKEAGLDRYNHNIETTEEFFSQICTTHTYVDRIETIGILKKSGLEICCGGILGLGETEEQRIDFAFALKKLDVDSLALNFLNPIAGTPLENKPLLRPWDILKIIAIFRFILPKKELRLCGGRQKNLRSLQPLAFLAGIDATIIGDYLTTKGSAPQQDIEMLKDLGFEV